MANAGPAEPAIGREQYISNPVAINGHGHVAVVQSYVAGNNTADDVVRTERIKSLTAEQTYIRTGYSPFDCAGERKCRWIASSAATAHSRALRRNHGNMSPTEYWPRANFLNNWTSRNTCSHRPECRATTSEELKTAHQPL